MSTSKGLIGRREYKVLSLLKIQKKTVGTQGFWQPKCRRRNLWIEQNKVSRQYGSNQPTLAASIYPVWFIFLLLFTCLSFLLSRFAPGFPFPKLPLPFFTLVVGENIGKDAPGNGLDGVLWNAGIVHGFLFAAQVSFFPSGSIWNFQGADVRTICGGWHDSFHGEQKMQTPVKPKPSACLHLLFCYAMIISEPTWPVKRTWNVDT